MSGNQRIDRLEERVTTLEKRCALLERHYAPTEHNPDSARLADILERLKSANVTLLWDAGSPAPKVLSGNDDPLKMSFTFEKIVQVIKRPCALCTYLRKSAVELPCKNCTVVSDDWHSVKIDGLPSHFKLNKDLR